jgi:ankyrin repeat protein
MATTSSGCTPLHVVDSLGISVPRMLRRIECSKGYTPLHKAAQKDHTEIMEYLVSTGASVHATSLNGRTPLHVAAVYGQVGYLTHYSLTNYSPLTH